MNKIDLKMKIYQYDFCIHEIALYLDSHPADAKAIKLLKEYRQARAALVKTYEEKYGKYVVTCDDVMPVDCWSWLKGPWPWENGFAEE